MKPVHAPTFHLTYGVHPNCGKRNVIAFRFVALFTVCLALILAAALRVLPVQAQLGSSALDAVLFVGDVEAETFPNVVTPLYVVARDGLPVAGLDANQLTVRENDMILPAGALNLVADNGEPMTLVLLLDRSTSPGDWANVTAAAVALLNQLRPGDRAALLGYSDGVELLSPMTGDLNRLRASLIGSQPGGAFNAIYAAIDDAYALFDDTEPGRRAIITIGDGPDNLEAAGIGPQPSPTILAQTGQQLGVAVHMYGYGTGAFAPDLQTLAAFTGGRALTFSTSTDLAGPLQTVPTLLRQGYLLSYRSTLPADNGEKVLSVALGSAPAVSRSYIARSTAIEVQVTSPADGATVSGRVVIGFSASAPADIRSVTFRLDNGDVITSTRSSVGGIIWDSAGVPPGDYRVSVRVEDAAGNTGQDDVSVSVIAPILLHVLISPTEVKVGETAVVTAFVQSAFEGTQVEAFVGRSQVGMLINPSGPARFAIDTSTFEPGRYGVVVRAANSEGYSVSDDSQVLSLTPPPPNQVRPNSLTQAGLWLGRWWPWIAGILVILILPFLLVWWILRERRLRSLRQQRVTLMPQVRLMLTNLGNVRTRYRLRAQDAEGALKFTFLSNGVALQPPMIMRMAGSTVAPGARPVAATNGNGAAQPAPGPVVATNRDAVASRASGAAEGAMQAAGVAGTLFTSLAQLLPGQAGKQARRVAGGIRKQQAAVKGVQFESNEMLADAQDVTGASRRLAGSAGVKTSRAAVPAQYATVPQSAGKPAAPNSAFALRNEAGAPIASAAASNAWVETPPLAPGETIGIDLHVGSQQRLGRNKQVSFRLMSVPADAENAPVSMEDFSVHLGPRR